MCTPHYSTYSVYPPSFFQTIISLRHDWSGNGIYCQDCQFQKQDEIWVFGDIHVFFVILCMYTVYFTNS